MKDKEFENKLKEMENRFKQIEDNLSDDYLKGWCDGKREQKFQTQKIIEKVDWMDYNGEDL